MTIFSLMLPRPPTATLFPYTTLFRSLRAHLVRTEQFVVGGERTESERYCRGRASRLGVTVTYALTQRGERERGCHPKTPRDRKSTRLNSSHGYISYAVFCLKKKKNK